MGNCRYETHLKEIAKTCNIGKMNNAIVFFVNYFKDNDFNIDEINYTLKNVKSSIDSSVRHNPPKLSNCENIHINTF